MSTHIKTNNNDWATQSNEWYNPVSTAYANFYTAFENVQNAVNLVNSVGDIGSLHPSVTMTEIEDINVKRRKMVSFCNAIHYEISEKVDNPFCIHMSELVGQAYDLDPSKIYVQTASVLGISINLSLTTLITSSIMDEDLRADFAKKCSNLDKDVPSTTLQQAIQEALFWESEFRKSEQCKTVADQIFTQKVREDWPNLTQAEREQILEKYAKEIGKVLGEGNEIITTLDFNAGGYGVSYGNGTIAINPSFVSDPTGNYSLDKVIDTITHETRHQYQQEVRSNSGLYNAPQGLVDEWKQPYIPSQPDYDAYYRQEVERDARAFAALSRP